MNYGIIRNLWKDDKEVKRRYWDSKFIGFVKCSDFLKSFEEALKCMDFPQCCEFQ